MITNQASNVSLDLSKPASNYLPTVAGTAVRVDPNGRFIWDDGTTEEEDLKKDINLLREELAEFMILNRITKEDIKSVLREVLDERFGCQCGTISSDGKLR